MREPDVFDMLFIDISHIGSVHESVSPQAAVVNNRWTLS